MWWIDRGGFGPLVAVALLAGCGSTAGDMPLGRDFGEAVNANVALQAGLPPTPAQMAALTAAFAAAAPDTVFFDFDSATLDPLAGAALDAQAAWLEANPGALMRLEGHADLVGGEAYNDRLGLRRARAVASALADRGVDPARLRAIESRGFREPVVPVAEPERRNRRVVTAVEGFGAPVAAGAGLDGKRALLGYIEYTTREAETVTLETLDE